MLPRERLFALEQFGIKLGLHNIGVLLDAMQRPERSFASVHVAGTNGKGSVTAMVERGLRAAGVKTGRYTSPHLDRIEERVAIDGTPVDAASFDAAIADLMAVIDRLRDAGKLDTYPTFFETTTTLAFELFRRHGVQVAVVEVGLGGQFDATNVIVPIVSVITSIAYDHERHLGHTIEEIAFAKAGIIKPGVPVVIGMMPDEAHAVVTRVAAAQGAPVVRAEPDASGSGQRVPLALNGAHQVRNAAIAVAALRCCAASGLPISRSHLITAVSDVQWPARLEWLRTAAGDVLIDAAHNPAGAQALADYLASVGAGPLPLVFAVMKDKNVEAMLRALAPAVSRFVATQVASPRAVDAHALMQQIRSVVPAVPAEAIEHVDEALEFALRDSGRAVAAGSIFLVGPLRAHLINRGAVSVRYPSTASPFFLN